MNTHTKECNERAEENTGVLQECREKFEENDGMAQECICDKK